MASRPNSCDPAQLRALLNDRLDEAELAGHLEDCEASRRELEGLAAAGRWWSDIRRFAGSDGPPLATVAPQSPVMLPDLAPTQPGAGAADIPDASMTGPL